MVGRFVSVAVVAGLVACSKASSHPDCIGTPSAEGEWEVFAGRLGDGQACTTPMGDLHVRYEDRRSDALVDAWRELIPDELDVELKQPWGAKNDYRRAVYAERSGDRLLLVDIVRTRGTQKRTVRLTWDLPQ